MFTLYHVFTALSIFLRVLDTAIFIYVIMSWFRPSFRLYYMLESFIRPFIMPFRRLNMWLMNRTRARIPLDFSCWFAMIGITILERLIWQLYFLLIRIL